MSLTKMCTNSPGAFPELLRRSRFASFDPTISQSYGTPPSHLHRGNWGLKGPIAQRKRNAFISLKSFEEREHYIEWNNAESQVRLIDRIEELNITPKLVPQVPWFVGLGPAASSPWSEMDSDFAPGESGMPHLPKLVPLFTPKLEGLGLRGKGEYGMKSSTNVSHDGYLHPNLNAMSPKVFKRYIKKLRSLRPEFQEFLKENGVTTFRESGIPPGNFHTRFLGQHFNKQFQDTRDGKTDVHPNQPQPIRQQPHRLGGLMYASPTFLESSISSGVYSGIVLEDGSQIYYNNSASSQSYLVSIAGIVGRLAEKRAGPNVQPAFNKDGLAYPPDVLLARQTGSNNIVNVKVMDIQLERLPTAVTVFPSRNISKEVSIRMELSIHSPENSHWRTNTHPPGSMLYNASEDSLQPRNSRVFNRSPPKMYNLNKELNKLREVDDRTNSNNTDTLEKLVKIHKDLDKMRGVRTGASGEGASWEDDKWIETPKPEE
jgi:hypothetical protein